ncbi:CpaF family protein [Bacteriovoracaceae bacterium]|nr:CpaF family protein [Bacteriovoracaceae bacterium]
MSNIFTDAIKNLLGPVDNLLEDDSISEILINGPHKIFVESKGILRSVPNQFSDDEALKASIRAIAQFVGKVIDENNPRLDARLPDGSRIAAVIPPLSHGGTTVAIRKFSKTKLGLKDLISFGSLSPDAARFLDCCIYLGKNLIVSGGTGSGKTTMLNVLGSRIPRTQRLLLIEDASELQIDADHVVRFEAQEDNPEKGIKGVSIGDLLKSALRLRPDRIVVGEVRGEEAIDLLTAMGTGHDGSMGTLHSNNPDAAVLRLETMCLSGESKLPIDALRKMISETVHLIVQCNRLHDGSRKTTHISEVVGLDKNGQYVVRDIFKFVQTDKDDDGKIIGEMIPMNYVPTFFEDFVANKLPFSKAKFRTPQWYINSLSDMKKAG